MPTGRTTSRWTSSPAAWRGSGTPIRRGSPSSYFPRRRTGREVPYLLHVAQVAPGRFQSDLRDYAARTSQGQWTGSLIEAAGEPPSQQLPLAAWGAAIAFLLLAAALACTIYRLRQERKRQARLRLLDPETGLGTQAALEDAFSRLERDQKRKFYYLICLRLNLERVGYLRGQDLANSLLLHASGLLKEAAGPGDTAAQLGDGAPCGLKAVPQRGGGRRAGQRRSSKRSTLSPSGGERPWHLGRLCGHLPAGDGLPQLPPGRCSTPASVPLAASRSGAGCQLVAAPAGPRLPGAVAAVGRILKKGCRGKNSCCTCNSLLTPPPSGWWVGRRSPAGSTPASAF